MADADMTGGQAPGPVPKGQHSAWLQELFGAPGDGGWPEGT